MATRKQIEANRKNSANSTGPTTAKGKQVSAGNATRHGILSTRLFLANEDPQAFQQLFEELTATLKPQGILEMVLIEKIAVTIWKQRRCIAAETATITLNSQNSAIFRTVNHTLKIPHNAIQVNERDLEQGNPEQIAWAESCKKEFYLLIREDYTNMTLAEVKAIAPAIGGTLELCAEENEMTVEVFLASYNGGPREFYFNQLRFAEEILAEEQRKPKVAELYQAAMAELSILADKPRDSYERYQATLDNQLYRAMKELRQLQQQRLSTIETVATEELNAT